MGLFRRNKAKQLVKDGDAEGLLTQASSDDEAARADAFNSLPALTGAMSPEQRTRAHDLLESAATDQSPDVRAQALFALWEIEGGDAAARVIEGLSDPDAGVRTLAAAMLGGGDPSVVSEPLISLLEDDEAVVRQTAAESLGALGDPRAEAPLTGTAEGDADAGVRTAAADALRQLRSS